MTIPRMADYVAEIPEVLRSAAAPVTARVAEIADELGKVVRIDLVGSGTSLHAALTVGDELEHRLGIEIRTRTPSEWLAADRSRIGPGTAVIAISQTGRSTGTIRVVTEARAAGAATVTVTGDPESAAAQAADLALDVGCGVELVGARTKGYVATVAALLMLADAMAPDSTTGTRPGTEVVANAVQEVIEDSQAQLPELARWLDAAPVLWIVSYGVGIATAREAALKLMETVQIPVLVYELEEYMHGPHYCLGPETWIAFIAPDGPARSRCEQLIDFAVEVGGHVLVVEPAGFHTPAPATRFAIGPSLPGRLDPLVSVIPFQLLADTLTRQQGREPGTPRYPEFQARLAIKTA